MDLSRYSRQTAFAKLGVEGQKKILHSRVLVAGCGALGSMIAERLCRAGFGFIRLVDRDTVDLVNLHRQTLYTEEDARLKKPKAFAAASHLRQINSAVSIDPVEADIKSSNIEALVSGMDIVLDGSDNFELRFLLNETCCKNNIPWVYGGAVSASGACMSIIPGGPCLRCLYPEFPEQDSLPNTVDEGILNMITGIVSCLEAAEAMKIIACPQAVCNKYIAIDLWENSVDYIAISRNPNCPVCGKFIV